jgi:hypothetical protein
MGPRADRPSHHPGGAAIRHRAVLRRRRGRFELSGDPFLALRFASLFRLPVVLDPVAEVGQLTPSAKSQLGS